MCGIVGIVRPDGVVSESEVGRMASTLRHRGPDESGQSVGPGFGFGFCRLSIIDLATGNQPVTNADGSVTSVMNGEIYNYRKLRESLSARGHRFRTAGDSEVIPHLYGESGLGFVNELRGMFAGALWDSTRSRLVLFRDRIGEKPLFYSQRIPGGGFAFASEPKALLALGVSSDPDWAALRAYLRYLYIPPPASAFRDIKKLEPGHLLEYDGGEARVRRYWQPPEAQIARFSTTPEQALRSSIVDAVGSRLVADVPVGAFLSGGVDSAAVVAAMKLAGADPIHTFTITFEGFGHYDESTAAVATAKHFGTEHHEIRAARVRSEDLCDVIDAFDEPFGNPTALLVSSLAEATREHVKVALTGDGGDELFLGYPRYGGTRLLSGYQRIPLSMRKALARAADAIRETPDGSHRARRAREFLVSGIDDPQDAYTAWVTYFSAAESGRLTRGELRDSSPDQPDLLRALMPAQGLGPLEASRVDLQSFLPFNVLEYADRMSMRHGLELARSVRRSSAHRHGGRTPTFVPPGCEGVQACSPSFAWALISPPTSSARERWA